jgi:hypothetical protein
MADLFRDEALIRLRRAGWSMDESAFSSPDGTVWVVSGSNGENLIRAFAPTRAAVWAMALEQARAVGMLDGIARRVSRGH